MDGIVLSEADAHAKAADIMSPYLELLTAPTAAALITSFGAALRLESAETAERLIQGWIEEFKS